MIDAKNNSMTMELTAENVNKMFTECLHTDEEVKAMDVKPGDKPEGCPYAEGIMMKVAFHPDRLREARSALVEMLNELPDAFHATKEVHATKGGGMSFLNMCMTRNDVQWAEHQTMDQLICLAIASGVGSYCMPREMWSALPGGMPYVAFDTEASCN